MRVLVADHDQGFVNSLADIARILGITVVGAVLGSEALDRATGDRFDLCLVNSQLPDMAGIQICNRIRRTLNSAGRALPGLALVTDSADARPLKQARASGLTVLSKPVRFLHLLELVQAFRPDTAIPAGRPSPAGHGLAPASEAR
jgi:two-component system response regulator MprA